jgi:hypothetical protein
MSAFSAIVFLEVLAAGFALMFGNFSGFASERSIVSTAVKPCYGQRGYLTDLAVSRLPFGRP